MVYLNFVCFDVKYFENFRPMNCRMQNFRMCSLLILDDLDLRSNERLTLDFYTPVLKLY